MFMLLVNKKYVMDDYLFSLKFTVSKSESKMLCHLVLISLTHCFTEIIFSDDLSDEFFGSLYLFLYVNLSSKKYALTKVLGKTNNLKYDTSKTKNKFTIIVKTIFSISKKNSL